MDVGYFISELLAQHGDVSVPGLGYFTHTRVNGYYNEREGKFYPPTYSVQFDPRGIEDEILTQYIADKKNISLASSKYFTEKFINSIKLQAQNDEAPLADLGWFYTEGTQLYFRPNTNINTDPDFFGYQPLTLHKLGNAPAVSEPVSSYASPAGETHAAPIAVPTQEETTEGFAYDTDEDDAAELIRQSHRKRRNAIITFVILAVLFTAAAVFLVNKYDPSVFNLNASQPKAAPKSTVINARVDTGEVKDTVKTAVPADTALAKDTVTVKDTVAKTPAAVNNITTGPHYEILGGSFATVKDANKAIRNYKTLGIEARILENVPGRKRKVTLGTYRTKAEAIAAQEKILNTKKIKAGSTYIQPYNIK